MVQAGSVSRGPGKSLTALRANEGHEVGRQRIRMSSEVCYKGKRENRIRSEKGTWDSDASVLP